MNTNEHIGSFAINDNNERRDYIPTRKQLVKDINDLDERDLYILDRNFNFKTSTITKKGKLMLIKIDYFRCFIVDNIVYIAKNATIMDHHLSNLLKKNWNAKSLIPKILKNSNGKCWNKFLLMCRKVFKKKLKQLFLKYR